MKLIERFAPGKRRRIEDQAEPAVVTLVGGLGSQIMSVSAFFYLQQVRANVFVDTSYFNTPPRKAGQGEGCSQWPWELDQYGITMSSLPCLPSELKGKRSRVIPIDDGAEKCRLALCGLEHENIRQKFELLNPEPLSDLAKNILSDRYSMIHIRQGDYLNVASHLVTTDRLMPTIRRVSQLTRHLVISSDSAVPPDFIQFCQDQIQTVTVLIDHPQNETHWLMRSASLLVTSNSTFSLTAACLNEKGFILIPRTWYGAAQQDIEQEILAKSTFCDFSLHL